MANNNIRTICSSPYSGQKPGTAGLRKKVLEFMQPNYLNNFVQAIFNVVDFSGKTLVLGGDGRFFNLEAIQQIIKMAIANNADKVLVGKDGIFSTPAVSCVIRKHSALGGIILSASHNPGGKNADFGIKYNSSNGEPANEAMTDAIYQQTLAINEYKLCDCPDFDLSVMSETTVNSTRICVIDSVDNYSDMLSRIFDFDKIKAMFKGGFSFKFDALNAVTGPYAKRVFEDMLGAAKGSVFNATPLEDFGGLHPDPNPANCPDLMALSTSSDSPDLIAASDGDGDRNMIIGKDCFVSPCDSLAIIVANAKLIPHYEKGLRGVARSMPTSAAVDKVAEKLNLSCYETPTGWKFFGNLMDAGLITMCGEESFGTSSAHIREKDGIWAVLCWLNILAEKKCSVKQLVEAHWHEFGRNYYARHDFEGLDSTKAGVMYQAILQKLPSLLGAECCGNKIVLADNFAYTDKTNNSISANQGIRIVFSNGSRIIFRTSGTGTSGTTLRVYFDAYRKEYNPRLNIQDVLQELVEFSTSISEIEKYTGVSKPTNIV